MRFNTSSRFYRLVVGFFSPLIFGSILFSIVIILKKAESGSIPVDYFIETLSALPKIFVLAMMFVGLQSLTYSIIMEFLVRPRVRKLTYFLLTSCFLGLLSGLIPGILIIALEVFLPIGILAGLFAGLLIYVKENEVSRQNA